MLSDYQEMKRNCTAQNIKDYEESCKRQNDLTWQRNLREAAAAEYAADAYIADEVPTPDQMFSDTDDGF